jgi:hypothetical protein
MKMAKKKIYELPDIMGEQLSKKEHEKKMKQLDKDMKAAIAKHKTRQNKSLPARKKSAA